MNITSLQVVVVAVAVASVGALPSAQPPAAQGPDYNAFYQIGPDSLAARRRAEGRGARAVRAPESGVSGHAAHLLGVRAGAVRPERSPASLMVFQDGQAFKDMDGVVRAPNVLDNLIYRREIPVMIAVFINPGRTPEQPEPTPSNWGDRDTNRPTEYNTLDDKLRARRRRRADAGDLQGVQRLEGSRSARHRRRQLRRDRRLHGRLAAAERLPQGAEHRRQLREPARRRRVRRHRRGRARRSRSGSFCRTAATTTAAWDAAASTISAATGSTRTSG